MATQVRIRRRGRYVFLLVAVVGAMSLASTAAFAQTDPYSGEEPEVLPTTITNDDAPQDEVLDERIQNDDVADAGVSDGQPSSSGVLPFTGADLTLFLMTGLAAIGTGSMIVKRAQL